GARQATAGAARAAGEAVESGALPEPGEEASLQRGRGEEFVGAGCGQRYAVELLEGLRQVFGLPALRQCAQELAEARTRVLARALHPQPVQEGDAVAAHELEIIGQPRRARRRGARPQERGQHGLLVRAVVGGELEGRQALRAAAALLPALFLDLRQD